MTRATPTPPCGPGPARPSRWRDGLLWLLGGIFAAVVGVNGVMVWVAFEEPPDLVRSDYYEASKQVNKLQAEHAASDRLGWSVETTPVAGAAGALAVRIRDRQGRPVSGLAGTVSAYRPADARLDQTLRWAEQPGAPGDYRAEFPRPASGFWRVTLDLQAGGRHLLLERPLVLP